MSNPFCVETDSPLVAIAGQRCGYVQLAPAAELTHYAELPPVLFEAARDWAAILEMHQACRVYWITLSEVVPHLHIHLYPRWPEDTEKGLALFEQREQGPQPHWSEVVSADLLAWSARHHVYLITVPKPVSKASSGLG